MALQARGSNVSVDMSTAMFASQIPDVKAGENLDAGAPCYIKAADGLVYMSDGTAANEAAKVDGICPRDVLVGEPVTLLGRGTRIGQYSTGMTPGQNFYVAATKGRLDTAATVGGVGIVARAINSTDIRLVNDAL